MATLTPDASLIPEMVTASVRKMTQIEIQLLEDELKREKFRRLILEDVFEEGPLFEIINEPLPHGERHQQLIPKWEAGTLSEAERNEMLSMVEVREEASVSKVAAVMRLSQLRGVNFEKLWRQIIGPVPRPITLAG